MPSASSSVTQRIEGHILTPKGFVLGSLEHWQGRIRGIEGMAVTLQAVRDEADAIVLPGFIDLHVHGGGGHDVMDGGDAAVHIARTHARHGTTAMLATTLTAPLLDLRRTMAALGQRARARAHQAARILGVHLEGPFINPDKLGAQPDFAIPASLHDILMLHELAPIRVITLAPEMDGHLELIPTLRQAGFHVQIGHSTGSYEQGVAALRHGASGFTHLFNAMSGLQHRAPGMVGAALAHARYAEIIPDLLHVHPGAIRAALRAIPCLYCVTDSTSATGMPDGQYQLGSQRVTKCMNGVRLADGTLAGSTLTMNEALRNLIELGLDLEDVSHRVSTHAADYLGLNDRGRLKVGAFADLVVLDRDLTLRRVIVEGEEIDLADV